MTYTTGQPIVFVGTGQTYQDLCTLNVQAVVSSLLTWDWYDSWTKSIISLRIIIINIVYIIINADSFIK